MGIAILWDTEEQSAIRWDFGKTWDQEDLVKAEQDTKALLDQHGTVVDLILNMAETAHWPPNAFNILKNALRNASRGTGIKVIVGANRFTQQLLKIYSRVDQPFVEGLTFVGNIEEAREILMK